MVELHDCFTANELLTYEALGLSPEGEAEKFIVDGDNTYGGKVVTNPSGGLLSKGHPLGATGLAQCTELVWQLRGQAEQRQVEGARLALQHNLGLGGACVVTLYEKVDMIDHRHIGHRASRRSSVQVEAGRLRFFAKATGQTDPVYADEAAARDAGHPACRCRRPSSSAWRWTRPIRRTARAARHRLRRVLHGEQRFRSTHGLRRRHARLRAADRRHLQQEGRCAGVRAPRDPVHNQHGALVAELTCLTVVPTAEGTAEILCD